MSPRLSVACSIAGFVAATMAPIATFGGVIQAGFIDVWSIHGMSPARMDGPMDIVQFGLAVVLALVNILAMVGRSRASVISRVGSSALVCIVVVRTARRLSWGVSLGKGVAGLILIFFGAL